MKLKPALVSKLELKVSVLPERGDPGGRCDRAINVGQEGMGEIRRLGAAEPAGRVMAMVAVSRWLPGISWVGEMDRVSLLAAALVDGGAGLGEREGLGVVVEDAGGDAGGGGSDHDRGAARVGGRRGQRHAVAFDRPRPWRRRGSAG